MSTRIPKAFWVKNENDTFNHYNCNGQGAAAYIHVYEAKLHSTCF